MKTIQLFVALVLATSLSAHAQHNFPRFGIVPGDDNTGRSLTFRYFLAIDKPGADTVSLAPRAWETIVLVNPVIDNLAIKVSSTANCYLGDKLIVQAINSPGTGHQLKFIGSNFQFGAGGATITLSDGLRASITFRFDGTAWVEAGRLVQSVYFLQHSRQYVKYYF